MRLRVNAALAAYRVFVVVRAINANVAAIGSEVLRVLVIRIKSSKMTPVMVDDCE